MGGESVETETREEPRPRREFDPAKKEGRKKVVPSCSRPGKTDEVPAAVSVRGKERGKKKATSLPGWKVVRSLGRGEPFPNPYN